MDALYTVYTYGNGNVIREVLNAVAALAGNSAYESLLRLMGLFALIWALASFAFKMNLMKFISWFFSMYLLLNLLVVPKMTVAIDDRLSSFQPSPVDNVPAGLVVFASVTSRIGDSLTQLFDEHFSLPDDLRYSTTGYLMASKLAQTAQTLSITNTEFANNLTSFVKQCVFYDVLLGKYSVNDLYDAKDVWSFISGHASPARAFSYNKAGTRNILICKDGIALLNEDWKTETEQSATLLGKHVFGPKVENPKNLFLSRLPVAMGFLTELSNIGGEKVMQQAMMSNALQSAIEAEGTDTNNDAAVTGFATTRGNDLLRSKFSIIGEEAATWLSTMGNVMNALLYGGFLIVVLLVVLPVGTKVIAYYVETLIWVQLWPPLYAMLNLVMSYSAKMKSMAAVASLSGPVIDMNTYGGLAQVNADMAAYAGYATLLIPMIAWGFVKTGSFTVTALASNMAGIATQAAARASEEATTGNYGFENVSLNNQHAFNTSSNHFNSNGLFQSGMTSLQLPDGSMMNHTQSGASVMDTRNAISSLGASINFADSMRNSAMHQSEQALTTGLQQSQQYASQLSSTLRSLYEVSDSVGHGMNQDNSASLSHSTQTTQGLEDFKQDVDEFSRNHGLTTAQTVKILGQAYAGADIAADTSKLPFVAKVKVDAGVKASIEGVSDAQRNESFSDAKRFVESHSLRSAVDLAERASQDEHVRQSVDNSQRSTNHVGSSFEKAESARHDAVANLQKSSALRETASFASEHAASINVNMSQPFIDWVAQQPGSAGLPMGSTAAEALLTQYPEAAREFANAFIDQKVSSLSQHYEKDSFSENSLKQMYEKDGSMLQAESIVEQSQAAMNAKVASSASEKGMGQEVWSNLVGQVQQKFQEAERALQTGHPAKEEEGQLTKQAVNLQVNEEHHGLTSRAVAHAKDAISSTFSSEKNHNE